MMRKKRTPGFADARAVLAGLILLTVGACAQLDRLPAVAVADTDRASVAGISEARFMASDTAALTDKTALSRGTPPK
jgi:hypothetical protein